MSKQMKVSAKTVEDAVAKALKEWDVPREAVTIEILEEPSRGFFGFGARDAKVLVTLTEVKVEEPVEPPALEEVSPGVVAFNEKKETPVEEPVAEVAEEETETTEEEPEEPEEQEEPEEIEEMTAEDEEEYEDYTAEDDDEENGKSGREKYFSEEEQETAAQRGREFLQEVTEAMGVSVMIEKMTNPERITLHMHGKRPGILIGKRGNTLDALQYLTNLAANKDLKGRYFIMLDVENYRSRREETLISLAHRMAGRVKKNKRKLVLEPMNAYERKIIHVALQDDPDVYTRSEGEYQDRHLVIHYRKD